MVRFPSPKNTCRVDGIAAGPDWKHALPTATDKRVSLTFRRVSAARRAAFDAIRQASAEAPFCRVVRWIFPLAKGEKHLVTKKKLCCVTQCRLAEIAISRQRRTATTCFGR